MALFDGFVKHLASVAQDVTKQAGPVAAAAWQHAEKLGQEAGRHLAPAGAEAWDRMVEVSKAGTNAAFRCANQNTVARSQTVLLLLHPTLFKT
jgi:hypothetical protein